MRTHSTVEIVFLKPKTLNIIIQHMPGRQGSLKGLGKLPRWAQNDFKFKIIILKQAIVIIRLLNNNHKPKKM